jgi:hypothetical protein
MTKLTFLRILPLAGILALSSCSSDQPDTRTTSTTVESTTVPQPVAPAPVTTTTTETTPAY